MEIPYPGERVELVPIGNHARGSKFINYNHHIDDALDRVFDQLGAELEGIYVCRFDLKTQSLESLKHGEEFSILEINGVAGEPAHIYDPTYPVSQAYRDLFEHWKFVYEVDKRQRKRGVDFMSRKEAWKYFQGHASHHKHFS